MNKIASYIRTPSISKQLIISIALVHAVLMSVFVFDLVKKQRDFLLKQNKENTLALSRAIATSSSSWVLARDVVGLQEIILSQKQHQDLKYTFIISPNGKVLAHTESSIIGKYVSDTLSLNLLKHESNPTVLIDNHSLIDIATPIIINNNLIGWVRVGASNHSITKSLSEITRDGVWYIILALLIGTVYAIFMSRGITSRLRKHVQIARRITNGDENIRISVTKKDELGTLGEHLNLMIDSILEQKDTIQKSQIELENHQNKLKELVDERTKELNTALNNLKSTQSQLVQSEKMASLATLTSGVAHEINNPLNFIQGGNLGLEKIFNNELKQEKPKVKNLLDAINIGVLRISKIVSSLKQLSSNNKNNEVCNISTVIDNCLLMLQNRLKNKITINKEMAIDEALVSGNIGDLHQMFANIITNAEQAIANKGHIDILINRNNSYIVIDINDNGIGIEKHNLKKITEPFFTTKSPNLGTGLGLSISHNIIKKHGGFIEFKSEIKKGTNVQIRLPEYNAEQT